MVILLEELRALCEAATPGPFHHLRGHFGTNDRYSQWWTIAELIVDGGNRESWYVCGEREHVDNSCSAEANAAYLAAAATAVPHLLAGRVQMVARCHELEAVLAGLVLATEDLPHSRQYAAALQRARDALGQT